MSDRRRRRTGAAIAVSSLLHVGFLILLLNVAARPYNLPVPEEITPPAPAMTVEIFKPPPEPPIVPPRTVPQKVEASPPAPAPAVPQPSPPVPTPTPPKPTATPAPARPAPAPSVPLPVATPRPQPAPQPPLAKPAPPTPAPAQAVTSAPKLNIHKAEKEAPATIATLPMAPAPSQPRSGAPAGAPASGGQPGGSRLSGLTPWPAGSMPSGGTGLRGTLVGCANAQAVKLSSVERAHCNERFGVELSHAPALDGIPPAKRAQFDAAAAKDDLTRRRMNAAVMRPTGLASSGVPDIGGGIQSGPNSSMAHSPSGVPGPHE